MRDAAAIRRWIKASSTASAQMKRGASGGFELALGAQPGSELVEAALFEVDEARALADLAMTGLAGLRLRRSRVRSLTGALCGIGGHDDSPLSKSIRWVQAASQRRAFYRGQRGFRSRQRSSTHVDAGRLGDDRDQLTGRGGATRARLARRLDPDRQLDQARRSSHPSRRSLRPRHRLRSCHRFGDKGGVRVVRRVAFSRSRAKLWASRRTNASAVSPVAVPHERVVASVRQRSWWCL